MVESHDYYISPEYKNAWQIACYAYLTEFLPTLMTSCQHIRRSFPYCQVLALSDFPLRGFSVFPRLYRSQSKFFTFPTFNKTKFYSNFIFSFRSSCALNILGLARSTACRQSMTVCVRRRLSSSNLDYSWGMNCGLTRLLSNIYSSHSTVSGSTVFWRTISWMLIAPVPHMTALQQFKVIFQTLFSVLTFVTSRSPWSCSGDLQVDLFCN